VRDVTVSAEDSLYPPPDEGRFGGEVETVFVHLSVEGLPTGDDMEARAERVASGSIFSLHFSPGPSIEILDEQEDQLGRPVKLGLERGDRHLEGRSRDEVR
jgi:hypothetical protein